MKIQKFKISFLLLLGLITLSLGFYSLAKENTNSQNVFLDSDQDGLSDEEERMYGTDPFKKDTDGDSYGDGTEVKSGYDPKKPAPGDKIIEEKKVADVANESNLTKKLASEISAMSLDENGEGKEISLDSIQSTIDDSLGQDKNDVEIKEITKDDIKIQKQNYKGLSEKKAKEKKKEDFTNYLIAVSYILSSNSPEPITSGSDMQSIFNSFGQQISTAITSRNPEELNDLSKSGEKILEQMKEVEVPEELVESHISAMTFMNYSEALKKYLSPNAADPVADIANLSKIQGLISNMSLFAEKVSAKIEEYDIQYDSDLKEKLKNYGIDLPENDSLINKKEE